MSGSSMKVVFASSYTQLSTCRQLTSSARNPEGSRLGRSSQAEQGELCRLHKGTKGQECEPEPVLAGLQRLARAEQESRQHGPRTWPEVADQPMVLVRRFWISRTPS